MTVKTNKEIATLREGGKRLAEVLRILSVAAKEGVTTVTLDQLAREEIEKRGCRPAFLHYTPGGATRPYPATLCTSINNEVVHGVPNENPRTLKNGDIIALDLGLVHEGLIVDAAITVGIGTIDAKARKLIATAKKALAAGIGEATIGKHIGDISAAIGATIEKPGFRAANELGGHGVGNRVHEEPFIPNWGMRGTGELLVEGMVLALEPIVNEGTSHIRQLEDGYTIVTRDGKRSAHFEHTILVTKKGPEILTR